MTIRKQIIASRKVWGHSCYYVCQATGISKGNMSKLENEPKHNPTLDTIQKLADFYKMPFTIEPKGRKK